MVGLDLVRSVNFNQNLNQIQNNSNNKYCNLTKFDSSSCLYAILSYKYQSALTINIAETEFT